MILHVDMDAFYASVEERDNPELVGKPVIVGGSAEGRGVVCAANYEARKYGVHSAMPAVTARRLCPDSVFLPVRMEHYAQISREIREIFHRFTPQVEPLSLDEAFLDVTGCPTPVREMRKAEGGVRNQDNICNSFIPHSEFRTPSSNERPAVEIARTIKEEIRSRVRLVASVGVAPNKFLAKIASDLEKPDGFVVVAPDRIQDFLDPLPVERLWGVGKVSGKAFQKLAISTIGQLRKLAVKTLESHFGKSGRHFWLLAHGIDDRRVVPDRDAKSISHETTFAQDIGDFAILRAWLLELTEQVARRLRQYQLVGQTVQLKIRFADFRTVMRRRTLDDPTNITEEIWQAAVKLLERGAVGGQESGVRGRANAVRLLGVGVSGLENQSSRQGLLFDEGRREKLQKLDQATDRIRDRFGSSSLRRAAKIPKGRP